VGLGSSFVQVGGAWIAKRSEFALGNSVRQDKGIAAEHVDVLETEGRQPGNVVGQDLVSLGPELIERRIHVNGVPEHDEVDDESERTKLVLLSLAIALAQFAALAMEEDAGELMASFATVELDEDASAIAVVVDKAQQVKRLDEAAQLLQSASEFCGPVVGLQGAGESAGAHHAKFQRTGKAQQVISVLGDQPQVDLIAGQIVEDAIIRLLVHTPEPRSADIGDA
jgi:hypothetical protein